MSFWEGVFDDLLGVGILLTVGLYLYAKYKGVSVKELFSNLMEVFK